MINEYRSILAEAENGGNHPHLLGKVKNFVGNVTGSNDKRLADEY